MKFFCLLFHLLPFFSSLVKNLGNYFKLNCPIKVLKSNAFFPESTYSKCKKTHNATFFGSEEVINIESSHSTPTKFLM